MAEVYLTAFIETARDKIVALLNALLSTMASGYDPTFSYVYEFHNEVMDLNAVSIGLVEGIDSEDIAYGSGGEVVHYEINFEIRVHTAYVGGVQNDQKNARLLNSITNKLKGNLNLAGGYWILRLSEIRSAEEFTESATLGGALNVTVGYNATHTQE